MKKGFTRTPILPSLRRVFPKNTMPNLVCGFTLVEVMVSVSITTLIMLVVLFTYGTFNDSLALSSAGQELSIAIRKAQTYGLAVKEVSVGSGQFGSAYGIYVNSNVADSGNYYIFIDKKDLPFGDGTVGNGKYDVGNGCGSSSTECLEKFTFRNGVKISSVCDAGPCQPTGVSMQATFLRPNPDATITFINSSGIVVGSSLTGRIVLISPQGKTETITILNTGQISVQ